MERKIKIFSFAAILMLAVSVIGCKHNVTNNTPETCSVTFGVDGTGGTLKAKVEGGSEINSGNTVEQGKTVTFTATPDTGYKVKGWTLDGVAVNGANASYALKVSKAANVKVSFEKLPPELFAVTFNVDGAGGTLKATADGVAETETSPIAVEHGKTVAFIATPAAGYRVKGWTLDGTAIAEAGTNTEYTLTVTKPATITVSFQPKKALLTLEAGKNTVKVKAKTADGKPITVEGCNVNELANDTETTLTVTNPERKLVLIGDIIELDCSGDNNVGGNRPLAELDVSGLTALQKLNCQFNKITALNVQGLTELQELYCRTNQIPELNVHGLTKLQKLNCIGNELTALDVQGCTPLQKLICNDNQLTALDVQGLNALQVLNCRSNKLTSLNAQGLTALQELICKDNQLKTLNVSDCTALQELNCQTNKLTSLNVQGLTALQELECGDNQLAELNVQGCTSLKSLLCFQNKLNVDAFTKLFNDLPKWEESDGAKAILYIKKTGVAEGNCTDFSTPETLKKAFEDAKNVKHWKMQKANNLGIPEDI